MVSGMISWPVVASSQSVMVNSPSVVLYVRSLKSAADRGRTAKRKKAGNTVRCFTLPVVTTHNQPAKARVPAPSTLYLIPVP